MADQHAIEYEPSCRWCRSTELDVALDLGMQPPADRFPLLDEPGPDATWPLRLGVCGGCGLAQLIEDPGTTDEPRGVEPQALLDQAAEAVATIRAAGLAPPGTTAAEFDSPHGGSWRPLLVAAGCVDDTDTGEPVDLVVDVFGLMHDADQAAALRARVDRLRPGGTLLLQFHALGAILRQAQWNALRHGHMAYYSVRALTTMLEGMQLRPYDAWSFELYGGTVLLAATATEHAPDPSQALQTLLAQDETNGCTTADVVRALGDAADTDAEDLSTWLRDQRDAGTSVVGYGAASRTVPLLVRAGIDAALLPAVADASPAKRGRCLPVSRIPVIDADDLRERDDDIVLLFVPDLLNEVRARYPELEARGTVWAVSEPRPRVVQGDSAGRAEPDGDRAR